MTAGDHIQVFAAEWPEVTAEDDLADLLLASVSLRDGDIVVLTSKVVSKAEGRITDAERGAVVLDQVRRVVARRGDTLIAETRHGLVTAAGGVDASNTRAGTVLLLPIDPDASARALRTAVRERLGVNVAVIITDTTGRAWRLGQTDVTIGCAGIQPLIDLTNTLDTHGNVLKVTTPAIADELAAAGDLVKGKTTNRPVAIVRGLSTRVLGPQENGPGASALLRGTNEDLFALGSREAAVAAALRDDEVALASFPTLKAPDADPFSGLRSRRGDVRLSVVAARHAGGQAASWSVQIDVPGDASPDAWLHAGEVIERSRVLAAAHRLRLEQPPSGAAELAAWRTVDLALWVVA